MFTSKYVSLMWPHFLIEYFQKHPLVPQDWTTCSQHILITHSKFNIEYN